MLLIYNTRAHGHATVYIKLSLYLVIFVSSVVYLKSMLTSQTTRKERIGLSVNDEVERCITA
jgi:hypothetical protein